MKKLEKLIINLLRKANYTKNERVDQLLVNVSLYSPLGILPGKTQEKYTEKAGISKTRMPYYSAGVGMTTGLMKYFLADTVDDYSLTEFIGMPAKGFAMYSLTDCLIRMGYTKIKQKPIGTLLIEGYSRTKDKINKGNL